MYLLCPQVVLPAGTVERKPAVSHLDRCLTTKYRQHTRYGTLSKRTGVLLSRLIALYLMTHLGCLKAEFNPEKPRPPPTVGQPSRPCACNNHIYYVHSTAYSVFVYNGHFQRPGCLGDSVIVGMYEASRGAPYSIYVHTLTVVRPWSIQAMVDTESRTRCPLFLFKSRVIGTPRQISPNLLLAVLKRLDPGARDSGPYCFRRARDTHGTLPRWTSFVGGSAVAR